MTVAQRKTDHELKQAVSDELAFTPDIDADRIGVAVHGGAVTLSGQVGTYLQKLVAVRAALNVRGVTAIADEIEVESVVGVVQDTDIARQAGATLEHSVSLPPGAVKASVHDHEITLTGEVDWQYQREHAERLVAALPGLRRIHNLITLKVRAVSAETMKSKITSATMRNAQLDANHITVAVTGHQVTLTGTVRSWAERRQAEQVAWSSPGISIVNNRITVAAN